MKKVLICLILSVISISVFGQSDEVLDRLYMEDSAKTLETALIVLQAANILTEESGIEDAKYYLEDENLGWGESILEDGEYISAGSFSLLVMNSFDIDKGFMFRILPNKRYALREMIFQGYILGNPYLRDTMTSFNVISVISSLPVNENINANYTYDEGEEVVTEEDVTEEVVTEEAVTEEAVTEEVVTEEVVTEEVVTEEVVTEEVVTEEVVTEVGVENP